LKIALLSHEGGGISTVCQGLASSLARKGVETTIFTTTTSRRPEFEKTNDCLKIVRLPLLDFPPRGLWFRILNSHRFKYLLDDYDVIHAVSPEMAFSFPLPTRFPPKSRLVASLHGSPIAAMKSFMQSPMRYWVPSDFAFHVLELPLHEKTVSVSFAKSSRIVTCSYTTLEELKTYERVDTSKAKVIYNGINFDEIPSHDTSVDDENSDSGKTLIYAGRLFWMKGIKFVLMAYENLRGQFKDLHLRVFGKGPMQNEIERFVASRGFGKDVLFGGSIPHRELLKEIARADVVVFPSLYESQPMFALEAMACRKPLVAFDLPYSREIIENGRNGLLAKPFDVKDLSNKIALLLQDRELGSELGQNAYQHVRERHDWNKLTEKYLAIYSEAT
jgi:glycosyltransferase involved in cell wall biosynthesis